MGSKFISYTDYTSLNQCDTAQSIAEFVSKNIGGDPASYCVYSSLVESAAVALAERSVPITAVCGGFPSSQTFLEVKLLDVAMALENGADEIDVVANIGAIKSGDIDFSMSEIAAIAEEIDGEALLKVIIETGALESDSLIYDASLAAMRAGADFIKTSTGKHSIGATHQAVTTICRAIKAYWEQSEKMVGIKIAGGITSDDQIEQYMSIVKQELGSGWITPALLRFGRSSL